MNIRDQHDSPEMPAPGYDAQTRPVVAAKHEEHIWGPQTGEGRMWALAIAKGWVDLVCVWCGKPKDQP